MHSNRLEKLGSLIGNTPVREITEIQIPNNNRIFVKEEWANPTGSHYDRIYLELFKMYERNGRIKRHKSRLIEVSSGCAGVSFAWFCKHLGYQCTVVLPKDLPESRIHAISKHKVKIVFSPPGKYIKGAVQELKEVLIADKMNVKTKEDRLFVLNHAENWESVKAMKTVVTELVTQITEPINFYVGVCGNGASLLGIGSEIKSIYPQAKVVSCDPAEAPVSSVYKRCSRKQPCMQNDVTKHSHNVYGSGAWGVKFPFLESCIFMETVDRVCLVSKNEREKALIKLHEHVHAKVGRTSGMALAAALQLCAETSNSNFLILFYDSYDNYF